MTTIACTPPTVDAAPDPLPGPLLAREVTAGVDTHADMRTAAAVDAAGCVLGSAQFQTTTAGYRALLGWLRGFGVLVLVGVEGTGVYGAGLTRFVAAEQVALVEVDRPDQQDPPLCREVRLDRSPGRGVGGVAGSPTRHTDVLRQRR